MADRETEELRREIHDSAAHTNLFLSRIGEHLKSLRVALWIIEGMLIVLLGLMLWRVW